MLQSAVLKASRLCMHATGCGRAFHCIIARGRKSIGDLPEGHGMTVLRDYVSVPKEHVNNAYLDVLGCPGVSWGIKTDRTHPDVGGIKQLYHVSPRKADNPWYNYYVLLFGLTLYVPSTIFLL